MKNNIHILYTRVYSFSTRIKKIEDSFNSKDESVRVISIFNYGYDDASSLTTFKMLFLTPLFIVPFYFYALFHLFYDRPKRVFISTPLFLPLSVIYKQFKVDKIIYSPHELERYKSNLSKIESWVIYLFEKYFLRFTDYTIGVNDYIARYYRMVYKVNAVSLYNSPPILNDNELTFIKTKKEFDFSYFGSFSPGRGLIELANFCIKNKLSICFIGFGSLKKELESLKSADENGLITVCPPLTKDNEIIDALGKSKYGIVWLDKNIKSFKYALPNKFFYYLRANCIILHNKLPVINYIDRNNQISQEFDIKSDSNILVPYNNYNEKFSCEVLKEYGWSFNEYKLHL